MARPAPFVRFVAPAVPGRALWRVLVGIVVIAAVYLGGTLGAIGLVALALGSEAAGTLGAKLAVASTPATALMLLATFVPMLAGTLLAVRLLHRRGPGSLFGPAGPFLRGAAAGAVTLLVCVAPVLLLWMLAFDSQPNLPVGLWLALLPATLVMVGIQTLAEETLFRGYLVQQLAARFAHPAIWAILPAIAFAVLHFDPARLGGAAPAVLAVALLFALAATDLTVRYGNLGPAWGLHMANNTIAIAGIATGAPLSGLALRATPYDADALVHTPVLLVADMVPLLAAWWILRRRAPA